MKTLRYTLIAAGLLLGVLGQPTLGQNRRPVVRVRGAVAEHPLPDRTEIRVERHAPRADQGAGFSDVIVESGSSLPEPGRIRGSLAERILSDRPTAPSASSVRLPHSSRRTAVIRRIAWQSPVPPEPPRSAVIVEDAPPPSSRRQVRSTPAARKSPATDAVPLQVYDGSVVRSVFLEGVPRVPEFLLRRPATR